jgi:ribosomal protein S18 acetylase RimI-like enzyme
MSLVDWNDAQKSHFLSQQFHAQQTHYQLAYAQADHHIIMLDKTPIGRLYVQRAGPDIRLLEIALLPAYRNRRIGTDLMHNLMAEAAHAGKPLRLHVDKYDEQALRFYMRLGFAEVADLGMHLFLEWIVDPVS